MTLSTSEINEIKTMEYQVEKNKRIRDIKSLGSKLAVETFTSERFVVNDKNRSAFNAAESFDRTKENMFLCGPTGCGKSHLAAIAARKILEDGGVVDTVTQMEISRKIRSAKTPAQEQDGIDNYAFADVLVIDDFGVGKDTEFSISILYEIIQKRYGNMSGGLIITSNLDLGQISQKIGDERISSRLSYMCAGRIFKLAGERDRRISR